MLLGPCYECWGVAAVAKLLQLPLTACATAAAAAAVAAAAATIGSKFCSQKQAMNATHLSYGTLAASYETEDGREMHALCTDCEPEHWTSEICMRNAKHHAPLVGLVSIHPVQRLHTCCCCQEYTAHTKNDAQWEVTDLQDTTLTGNATENLTAWKENTRVHHTGPQRAQCRLKAACQMDFRAQFTRRGLCIQTMLEG